MFLQVLSSHPSFLKYILGSLCRFYQ